MFNLDHLLEQAERLIAQPPSRVSRQIDLRRAISSAYYSLFHAVLTAASDQIVGRTKRNSPQYTLVYRSIHHNAVRDLCNQVKRQRPNDRYARYVPSTDFSSELKVFAETFVDLQEKRHSADYDPNFRVRTAEALAAVVSARRAIKEFANAPVDLRQTFLVLLLFPPR